MNNSINYYSNSTILTQFLYYIIDIKYNNGSMTIGIVVRIRICFRRCYGCLGDMASDYVHKWLSE